MHRENGIPALIFGAILVSFFIDAHAFGKHQLLDYMDPESRLIGNGPSLEEVLGQVRSQPTTLENYFIRFNDDLLDSLVSNVDKSSGRKFMSLETKEAPVYFFSPSGKRAELDRFVINRKRHKPSDLFIYGSRSEGLQADLFVDFMVSFSDGAAIGLINIGNNRYSVSSLDENLHIMILLDTSKSKPCGYRQDQRGHDG